MMKPERFFFLTVFESFAKCSFQPKNQLTKQFLQCNTQVFSDRGPYRIETSPLICRADQWTGFYMIGISVMKELNLVPISCNDQSLIYSFTPWVESKFNLKKCIII